MTIRRRIDVNLEELDQIIDRSTQAPLSESDGKKLKTAIHAMAERLSWKRNPEKTSAVLPRIRCPTNRKPANRLRDRSRRPPLRSACYGEMTIARPHSPATVARCLEGKVYSLKGTATLVRVRGARPARSNRLRDGRLRCSACGQIFSRRTGWGGPDKYERGPWR
jgi:hypothetical protein